MTKSSGNGLSAALLIKKITSHLGNHQIWMLLNNKPQITCHIYIFLPLKCWAIRWGKMGEGQKEQQIFFKKWAFNYVRNLFAIGFIVFYRLLVSQIDLCHFKLIASPDARRTAVKPKRVRWSWATEMKQRRIHRWPYSVCTTLSSHLCLGTALYAGITFRWVFYNGNTNKVDVQASYYSRMRTAPIGPLYHPYLFPWKASQLV